MKFKILGKILLKGTQDTYFIEANSLSEAEDQFKIYYPDGTIDEIEEVV